MLPVAVALSPSRNVAIVSCISGFVDDMFSHSHLMIRLVHLLAADRRR